MNSTTPGGSSLRLRSSLGDEERILILGATGWFGTTLTEMLIGSTQEVMYVASNPRVLKTEGTSINVLAYDRDLIRAFRPTTVVDFAFLTREKAAQIGLADFQKTNEELTRQLIEVAALPSVKKVLFTSSGAAVYSPGGQPKTYERDPYGYLKNQQEIKLKDFAKLSEKSVLCLRPWSVSGRLVGKPMEYAFSSLIIQALQGQICLETKRPVFRRYCALDDMLAVAFSLWPDIPESEYRLLESGGELHSLVELAELVADLVGNGAAVSHSIDSNAEADRYYSDNISWSTSCDRARYTPKNLKAQILDSIHYYREMNEVR
jgi:nucleoside-diphosphate-sugar epimerase